ncbi:MAG TPA: hypothetical protein PLK12_09825 [Prolixibacteraceae bacterium]|nr:hypothetical protein [Prolixibacteraceae bacterium]
MKALLLFLTFTLITGVLYAQNLESIDPKKPVQLSGSLSATTNFYNTNLINSVRDPFLFLFNGQINVSVYGVNLPFTIMYSNRNFEYSQPFNRFGVSPQYKWIKIHLGYRSVTHSSFTLAGQTFLGAGVELTPGLFRLSAVYGRFKKKTIPNTINPIDTLATPSRTGYSMKIGVGNEKNFFDLIAMNIADDTLPDPQFSPEQFKTPQSNTVLGAHLKLTLAKNLSWETEASVSLLTKDRLTQTINFDDVNLLKMINRYFSVNESSEYATALLSSLQYANQGFVAGIQYRRIDPNYQSFGAYYFNTDIENLTLNTSLRLFQKKLLFKGNIGLQNDNLRGNKSSASRRIISMLNINYNSGRAFSFDGSFSNYSINQYAGRVPLNDTLKLYNDNLSVSLSPRLMFASPTLIQLLQLNLSLTDLVDHNPYTEANSEINSRMALLTYSRNYVKTGFNLSAGIQYITLESAFENRIMYGANLGISKAFLKNKLNANLLASYNNSVVTGYQGSVFSGNLMINYRPHRKHLIKFSIGYNDNVYPVNAPVKSFHEFKTLLSYAYTF